MDESTSVTPSSVTSATKRKFGFRQLPDASESTDGDACTNDVKTTILRCEVMSVLVEDLACTLCGCTTLIIRPVDCNLGVVCLLQTYCTSCESILKSTYSSDRLGGTSASNAPFVVTRSVVAATVDMGVGRGGLVKLCRHLDMNAMTTKTYTSHVKVVASANLVATSALLDDAVEVVRRTYIGRELSIPTEAGILDLTVSFDGTWMTRGHKSKYGLGCVVEIETGLVIDFVIMSLHCHSCAGAVARYGGEDTDEYKTWKAAHRNCNINYSGSSGGMEAAAAEQLWERSIDKFGFRYTTLLSDGDAKTYNQLCSKQVYGDTPIEKEECVNHVSKRLGTALRKLSTESKKKGVALGGRGYGKLTQATITKLTAYYGKAIRAHRGNRDAMTDAVFATFYHAISTDDHPQHDRCPDGEGSWCFFKRAQATGETPGPHRDNIGTPLSPEVAPHVKEVYARLGHPSLLGRCVRGETQNANESLHSKIWGKCPKTGFVGLERLTAASCSAICEFNSGVELAIRKLCDAMDIMPGTRMVASAQKADAQRLRQSLRQAQVSTKEARRARKVARAARQDSSTGYAPGAF